MQMEHNIKYIVMTTNYEQCFIGYTLFEHDVPATQHQHFLQFLIYDKSKYAYNVLQLKGGQSVFITSHVLL